MGRLWELRTGSKHGSIVELAACEAWAELGKIPRVSLAVIKEKAGF